MRFVCPQAVTLSGYPSQANKHPAKRFIVSTETRYLLKSVSYKNFKCNIHSRHAFNFTTMRMVPHKQEAFHVGALCCPVASES